MILRSALLLSLLLSAMDVCASTYPETILADQPAIYWRFEGTSFGKNQSSAVNTSGPRISDLAKLADGQLLANGPNRRGVAGLAAAFDRTHLAGRAQAQLTHKQNAIVERILNGSFSLELWLLDEAPQPDGKVNSSLFYKPDPKRFWRNSVWLYRARQDGHYHFRIHPMNDDGDRRGLLVRNPAGEKAAGDRKWHHLTITVSRAGARGTMSAYLDGQKADESTFPIDLKINNTGPLTIGNGVHPNSPWQGLIDEFALYDRVLDVKTIAGHHAAGLESLKLKTKIRVSRAAREEFFELKIRPLLIEKCADCHDGEADSDSVLSMNSRQALIQGGDFGPAIIPGRAEDSLLIHAVKWTHKEVHMPPEKSDALTRAEIANLVKWVDDGAVWPNATSIVAKPFNGAKSHIEKKLTIDPVEDWALISRQVVDPPNVKNARWSRSVIDRFLQAKRIEAGLGSVSRADRRTLIRRATFDLTGLPPSPAQVDAFLADKDDDQSAFAKVVDRLLASQQYGERAGRLWLDVARYADTQGDVGDIPIQTAWLYRNWVIDSLNSDRPFDDFIQAQIAGDLIAKQTLINQSKRDLDANNVAAKEARNLTVATGFIALSRRFGNTKKDDIHLTIEDTIDTIGRGVLGLTLRCARCHDHKFDPILNTDYYGMYGIFESTVYPWMGMSNEKSPSALSPAIPSPAAFKIAEQYWALITRYEYQINNHFRPWLKPTLDEFKSISKEIESSSNVAELKSLTARREKLLEFKEGRFRELMLHGLNWIKKEKTRLAENSELEYVFAVSEGEPHNAKIHRRGNPRQPGPLTPRRFLQAVDGRVPPRIISGSGRLELARWLTRPDHPLTARVIVNRIWQQHFGRGLVATLDNFGRQGAKPSHPKLLDWLAESFVRNGWSLKKLHRQIMLTETYQLSAVDNRATDPNNIYLTRFQRRRLDAESIRDSLLDVSGQLDRTQGQAHAIAPWHKSRFSLNSPFHQEPPTNRRSVYLLTQRLFRHSFLGLFDGPDRNSSTSSRGVSNVPTQALFLMNSTFVKNQAKALAKRLVIEFDTDQTRIARLYRLAFSRSPTKDEVASSQEFLNIYRSTVGAQKETNPPEELVSLCRAVLTSNEFFFID